VVAITTLVAAIAIDGVPCQVALLAVAVLVPAAWARESRAVIRQSLLLSLPLVISIVLLNVLLFPDGATVVAELGPFVVTQEGIVFALEVTARVLTMAGAATLFYLSTRPSELSASLLAHGVPPKASFVIHNSVAMIPRLADRAAEVTSAQRARGFDTEGNLIRRARGVLAVAAPTVLGAIAEADTRTLAMESRGFSSPGPRTQLWTPHDSTVQMIARWLLLGGVGLLIFARLTGWSLPC
jgi:energy-coupling factor transport system permease protein